MDARSDRAFAFFLPTWMDTYNLASALPNSTLVNCLDQLTHYRDGGGSLIFTSVNTSKQTMLFPLLTSMILPPPPRRYPSDQQLCLWVALQKYASSCPKQVRLQTTLCIQGLLQTTGEYLVRTPQSLKKGRSFAAAHLGTVLRSTCKELGHGPGSLLRTATGAERQSHFLFELQKPGRVWGMVAAVGNKSGTYTTFVKVRDS